MVMKAGEGLDYEGLTPKGRNKDSGRVSSLILTQSSFGHQSSLCRSREVEGWGGGGAGKPQMGRKGGAVRKGRFAGQVPIGGNEVGRAKEGPRKEVTGSPAASKGGSPRLLNLLLSKEQAASGAHPFTSILGWG